MMIVAVERRMVPLGRPVDYRFVAIDGVNSTRSCTKQIDTP